MSALKRSLMAAGAAALVAASVAHGQVRPSGAHAFFNFIPFGGSGQVCTQHQVFDSGLWSGPMEISALGFAANNTLNGQNYQSDIVIKLGYTNKIPGVDTGSGGLDVILSNNPSGPMTEVFNATVNETLVATGSEDFSFVLTFNTPWCYDPSQGNLLVEIFSSYIAGADLSVSRAAGSAESSRAYNSTRFGDAASPTTATRMDFYEDACGGGGTLVERFEDPFGGWTSRWFYQNTNAGNYYVATGNCDENNRGNNPCGLWIVDTQTCGAGVGGPTCEIVFDAGFGSQITRLAWDHSGFVEHAITVYDMNNNVVLNVPDAVLTRDQCSGQRYEATSSNGISRVVMDSSGHSGSQIEGNTAWDNVEVDLAGAGIDLTVTGSCPGQVTVVWSNAQQNATVALIFAQNTGSFVIPFGPCQGTVLGLGNRAIRLVNTFPSGLNGTGRRTGNAGSGACGGYLQMHDIPNCTLSNVAQLP